MVILEEKTIIEILTYLEKSIERLAKDMIECLEFQEGHGEFETFVSNQFDIRLESLLKAKNSSIHHLESRTKNRILQKKRDIIESLSSKIPR